MLITIKNLQKKIPIYPKRIKKTILEVLSKEKAELKGELTVSFVNDDSIRKLNRNFLGKNYPTDVLAFDISNFTKEKQLFADIVISADTAIRNAKLYNTSPLYELRLYVIHGLLHLLGYKDNNKKNRLVMSEKEKYCCSRINI